MNVRFDILAWLLVPLAVTLLALLWVGWRARPKGPADAQDGMADLLRFREAMSKPLPGPREPVTPADERSAAGGPDRGAA